jgi:hypothetical protein
LHGEVLIVSFDPSTSLTALTVVFIISVASKIITVCAGHIRTMSAFEMSAAGTWPDT